MIKLHKNYIDFFKRKFNLSEYSLLWISFLKGLILGIIIYHFFLK